MRIAIMSDTHDNWGALKRSLQILEREEIALLLHCGDLCSPEVLRALPAFDVYVARGNMDRHVDLEATARDAIGPGRFADRHELTLGGVSALLTHGHREGELRQRINSGNYAYVFHGHTHRQRDEQVGATRVINPGAIGVSRLERQSFCILDVAADEVTFITI